ncbi:MAG: DUF512 domain-containing protein [Christensenellales bacterium]
MDSYEDFPQFENGVGLLCRLKDEYETAVRLDPDEGQAEKRKVIMACGTSVAPFLQELITAHPVSGVEIQIKTHHQLLFRQNRHCVRPDYRAGSGRAAQRRGSR